MRIRKRRYQRLWQLAFLMVFLFSTCPLLAASNVKLSGVMPPFGDVTTYAGFEISPNGRYAVYLADQDTDGVIEIYSVFLDGGYPVRLNPPLSSGRNVASFQISRDSSRVVYRVDDDLDLYSVPIGGPAGVGLKLNGPSVYNGPLRSYYAISPDSSRVVYVAGRETDVVELYSVPIGGPATSGIKLNDTLVAGGDVDPHFQISPDGNRVVYVADQEKDGIFELYSVPIGGPATSGIKLNGTLGLNGNVTDFKISPNGSQVVYRADQEKDGVAELYSVAIGGPTGSGIKLNGTLVLNGNVTDFKISPNGSRVVYRADQEKDGVVELYSVAIGGPTGSGIKLNGTLVAGWDVGWSFEISPDSSRVVWTLLQSFQVTELYSVPIGGPATSGIKLNGTLGLNGNVTDFKISPDGSRVVFRAEQQTANAVSLKLPPDIPPSPLYSVPIGGPGTATVKLNSHPGPNGQVTDFKISPDSSRVLYRADQDTDYIFEIYSVPIGGPAVAGIKLNGDLVAFGDVVDFKISPDSSRVVYTADQQTDEVFELFMTTNFSGNIYLPIILKEYSEIIQLTCWSVDYQPNQCSSPIEIHNASIAVQVSDADCIQDVTWGFTSNYIWVNDGCRATFNIN